MGTNDEGIRHEYLQSDLVRGGSSKCLWTLVQDWRGDRVASSRDISEGRSTDWALGVGRVFGLLEEAGGDYSNVCGDGQRGRTVPGLGFDVGGFSVRSSMICVCVVRRSWGVVLLSFAAVLLGRIQSFVLLAKLRLCRGVSHLDRLRFAALSLGVPIQTRLVLEAAGSLDR